MEKKKNNNKLFIIGGIVIVAVIVVFAIIINMQKQQGDSIEVSNNDIVNKESHTYGNTNEHNSNDGRIATDDEYWYYTGELGIFKQKKSERAKQNSTVELFSASSLYLNLYANDLYFLNLTNNTIYRIDKDGNNRTEIKKDVKSFFIIDDYIYYDKKVENGERLSGIYRMNLKGENEELIADYTVSKFRIYNNGIIFVVGDYLAYTDLNGNNLKKVKEDVTDFKLTNKFILYADKVENDSIYALSIDSETNEMKSTKMSNTNEFTKDLTLQSFILNEDYIAIIPVSYSYKDMVIFNRRNSEDTSAYYTKYLTTKSVRDFTLIDDVLCIVYENGRTAQISTTNSDFKKVE